MSKGLELLSRMEYPGRVIIIGRSQKVDTVVMYAITGRSPSSQARRLIIDESNKTIFVKPTDEETLKTGQPELLVYSSVIYNKGLVVSNGKQTDSVREALDLQKRPADILLKGLETWDYEPDEPNYTPRISGCVTDKGAALSVIKRAEDGSVLKYFFDVPLIAGKGKLIATYTGDNEKPLPSFYGEPLDVDLSFGSAEECVEAMYAALAPEVEQPDYRVSCACVFVNSKGSASAAVKNRHDL